MIRLLACCWLLLAATTLFAQQKRLQIDRPLTGETFFLDTIQYDPTLTSDAMDSDPGSLNSEIITLPDEIPPNTEESSTFPVPSRDLFSTQAYPVRTSVKLFAIEDDTLRDLGTAQMISRRHLLTGAIFYFNHSGPNKDSLKVDSTLACPMYDKGNVSPIPCQLVTEVAHFEDYSLSTEHMAVLTVQNNIGDATGWLGLAYNESEEELVGQITHRFSYPTRGLPPNMPNYPFNGDTLYYQTVEITSAFNFLGSEGPLCVEGVTGSSLIRETATGDFLTYGPLTFASECLHSRLFPRTFYPLRTYIEDNLTSLDGIAPAGELVFYPNPAKGRISVTNWPRDNSGLNARYQLVDMLGKNMTVGEFNIYDPAIDFSNIPAGNYYLTIWNEELSKSGLVIIKN